MSNWPTAASCSKVDSFCGASTASLPNADVVTLSSFYNEFAKQLPVVSRDFRTRELSIPQPPLRSPREEMHLPFSCWTSGMSIRPPDTNQQITRKWYMRESVKYIKSLSTLNLTKHWNILQHIETWNIFEIASSLRLWHRFCLDFKLAIMAITWTRESTSDQKSSWSNFFKRKQILCVLQHERKTDIEIVFGLFDTFDVFVVAPLAA